MAAPTIGNIQVLRALAAYMVVYHHAQISFNNLHRDALNSSIGAFGVDIFFVISGFIMVYVNEKADKTPIEFWRDRIIRIVPLYWLVTLVIASLSLLGLRPFGLNSNGWSGFDLTTSLFFVPHIRQDGMTSPIHFLGWTLNYEMFFYVIFGLTLLLSNMFRTLLAVVGSFALLWAVGLITQPTNFVVRYYTNPIMLEFSAGCVLGFLYSRSTFIRGGVWAAIGVLLIAIGFTTLIIEDLYFGDIWTSSRELRPVLVGIPATSIVAGAVILDLAGFRHQGRFLLLQGAASYAVYLLHPLILQIVFKALSKPLPVDSVPSVSILIMLVAFAGVVAGATLVHIYLERPVGAYLSRLRLRSSDQGKAPAAVPVANE